MHTGCPATIIKSIIAKESQTFPTLHCFYQIYTAIRFPTSLCTSIKDIGDPRKRIINGDKVIIVKVSFDSSRFINGYYTEKSMKSVA